MTNLTTYKPPLLAVLESHTKMRDYSDSERLTISKLLVQDLLNDLGVGKNSDTQHHIRAIKHVCETLGHYTKEEIQHAFQLFVSCKLNLDPYQQVNSVVIGKIFREYHFYKTQKLKLHRQSKPQEKVMTDEDKEFIMLEAFDRVKKEYKQHGKLSGNESHIYNWLFKKGKLPKHTDEFRDNIEERAKEIAKVNATKSNTIDDIQTVLSNIKQGKGNVKSIAKRLVLEEYINNLK